MAKPPRIKFGLIGLIILGIVVLGYAYSRARAIINGPRITVTSLTDGEIFTDPLIHVTGSAPKSITLTLNDRPISIDISGNFDESLLLPPGYTIITLDSADKFGKKDHKSYQVYYKIN